VASPSTFIPLQTEPAQEEDNNPDQRAVRRGVDKQAARAREFMVNKYEKCHEVTEFEIGDYCTIQVSKKDHLSGASATRVFYRVLQRRGHLYTFQTKHGILCSRCTVKNLNQIDQATAEVDAREIGNNRRKIILR